MDVGASEMDLKKDGWMDGWMEDGWIDGGWMDGWMDGGWMDDGWMDGALRTMTENVRTSAFHYSVKIFGRDWIRISDCLLPSYPAAASTSTLLEVSSC
jgi:hypothetical protein